MKHHIVCSPGARIIIDKAALDAGEAAIQVVRPHTYGINRTNFREVRMGDIIIRQHETPQQDGTRIEIIGMGMIEVKA